MESIKHSATHRHTHTHTLAHAIDRGVYKYLQINYILQINDTRKIPHLV